ncbi:LysR family transcriptional regulator [Yoonia litorea]|uniref:DNA-binding transcriptional regulator, LysR family n=1 Tax=Yoonia litorea TaxID=1123755 RepID=A0A1I6LNF1_9RHOB|nr:LysR substrate-binding domain-containing protein [Yoonia litorea]SFS04939.1 DNA-binding transcriptional regulator, LysR family [Yoonia litorea]
MSIKIEMLRCFAAVVEHGRLADAASSLDRTTSAVSMMLSQFEDRIGKPLFETSRKSKLTPLGTQIYNEARRELDHFDRTISNIEGLAVAQIGRVRLAVTPSVGSVLMPSVLQTFMARYPDVRVEMRDMTSVGVQQALSAGEADIGIATLGPSPGLRLERLFTDDFGVVCRKDNVLALANVPVSWSDLGNQTFIANGLCSLVHHPGFQPTLQNAPLNVPNTSSLLALVRAGVGVTLLPKLALLPMADDLAFLPLADDRVQREVFLAAGEPHLMSPAANAFVATIKTSDFHHS